MNRISWGEALRVVIGPALLVGPLVGAIGAFLIFVAVVVISAATESGSTEGIGSIVVFAIMYGAILGVFIASPFCVLFGTVAFKQAIEYPAWQQYRYWLALGCAPGLIIVAVIAMTGEADAEFLGWATVLLVATGMIGAAICRRMLEKRFDEFALRDIQDVF